MPNILKDIRTCLYDASIAEGDTIKEVDDGSSGTRNKVSVLPSQENGRQVHTAISLVSGAIIHTDSTIRLRLMNERIPMVRVSPQTSGSTLTSIYGALETVNTSTRRCGVLTKGVVLFRNSGRMAGTPPTNILRELPDTGIGGSIIGPGSSTVTGDVESNSGTVQYGTTGLDPIGSHLILGKVGNYVLVQLGADCVERLATIYT